MPIDTYSTWYGDADGYSLCSDSSALEFSEYMPEWMSVTNSNVLSIGSASKTHKEESFDLKVTIKRDDFPDIVRYFNTELQCTLGDPCDLNSG